MSVSFPLPANLPTDFTNTSAVTATGTPDAEHGYLYLNEQVNAAQEGANQLNTELEDHIGAGGNGLNGSGAAAAVHGVATESFDGFMSAEDKLKLDGLGSVPAGAVLPFAMTTPPTGWLLCNGALVSRTSYATLFAAIGTTFGAGDLSTTFGLPDLRGEFVRGWDDGAGVDTGRIFGSTQTDAFAAHTHTTTITPTDRTGTGSDVGNGGGVSEAPLNIISSSVGGGETRPKNIALLYCIKY